MPYGSILRFQRKGLQALRATSETQAAYSEGPREEPWGQQVSSITHP